MRWSSNRYAVFDTVSPFADLLLHPVGTSCPLELDQHLPFTKLAQPFGGFTLGVLVSG